MKTLIHKETGISIALDEVIEFKKGYLVKPYKALNIKEADYTILDCRAPALWQGGNMLFFDGSFTPINIEAFNEFAEEQILGKKEKSIKDATNYINIKIQTKIDDYNKENGTDFENVNALPKFVLVPTYEHNKFCLDVINWVAKLWETARNSKATNTNEFIEEIEKVVI